MMNSAVEILKFRSLERKNLGNTQSPERGRERGRESYKQRHRQLSEKGKWPGASLAPSSPNPRGCLCACVCNPLLNDTSVKYNKKELPEK